MKHYLNRAEKNQVLTISAFVGYLAEKADEWEKVGRSKETIKYLRMSKSFANKALDGLFEGLDKDQLALLVPEIAKMDLTLKYKDTALREYKDMLKLDSVTPVETNDLLDICAQAIEICKVCEQVPSECRLRKLLIKYDVAVLNEEPGEGKCPYQN